jgi:hypothetical protein
MSADAKPKSIFTLEREILIERIKKAETFQEAADIMGLDERHSETYFAELVWDALKQKLSA